MFEDVQGQLRKLQRMAERMDGNHEVPFGELFNDEFMLRNSDYPSISAFIDASGFDVQEPEDFAAIPDEVWEQHVQACSRFRSWQEMKELAATEWFKRQMGLD